MLKGKKTCALLPLVLAMLLAACDWLATPSPVDVTVHESAGPTETEAATVESPSGPDLVIQSFDVLTSTWALGAFEANAEVVVQNVGDMPAPAFEVSIVGINRESNYVLFYYTDGALAAGLTPGQEATLIGETGLNWHGHFDVMCTSEDYDPNLCAMHDESILWLMAIADYCAGDEVPDHCTVQESDEENNTSEPVVVEKAVQ